MAINVGYEILVDASVVADKKAELVRRIIQVLESQTLSLVYATTYAAGSSSTNQATITVGGSSADFGLRVVMDSAVVGTGVVATLLKQLIQILESETITIAHSASYTAGTRTYNIVVTVT
jgi:hypothetical protein